VTLRNRITTLEAQAGAKRAVSIPKPAAQRVAEHKARGKYICATISPRAAAALERIQAAHGCSQREAIERALGFYADPHATSARLAHNREFWP